MYVLSRQLNGLPILSLQSGQPLAAIESLVIDPTQLEIVAMRCHHVGGMEQPVVTPLDIRQVSVDGIIVDSEDALTDAVDIIRLAPLLNLGNFPLHVPVVSDMGRKLGKIEEFTINLETFRVQKLHIRPGALQSLMHGSLIIDRSQIIDIKPELIVVRDVAVKVAVPAPGVVPEA